MQRPALDSELPRTRGRPRDPQIEARILAAAARVYGASGWAGFSLDAVARAAGIGKSTLYARWTSGEDLLCAMIEQRWRDIAKIDTGDLRGDLVAFGTLVLTRYLETGGGVARHVRRDLAGHPELAARIGPVLAALSEQAIAILRRARARGELRDSVSAALASDMLLSAMESHAGRLAPGEMMSAAMIATYAERVADLLIGGIGQRRLET
ncbi:TetR/AcrR family transcriptional regulator [Novosphingobium sp.]|uniref:TetR/AcrR family transcriptional regulator n=1 Tax=Novosphingobium sp. TaxID=1874826 RepID=UPI00260FCD19|nr:TetR/AcrR family transcriptional regulator [Novosphingobium sp.]